MTPMQPEDPPKQAKPDYFRDWLLYRRGLFPAIYTSASFALFVAPVVAGLKLAMDPSVIFWIGYRAWFLLLVPVLLLVAHGMHVQAQGPQLLAIVLSSIVPAITLIVVGYDQQIHLSSLVSSLSVGPIVQISDWKGQELKEAYDAAEQLLEDCFVLLANRNLGTEVLLKATLVLQDCPAYLQALPSGEGEASLEKLHLGQQKWRREWNYLSTLERTEGCAGWSTPGKRTLWTAEWSRDGDPCAVAAWAIMSGQDMRDSNRLIIVGLLILLVAFLVLAGIQQEMRSWLNSITLIRSEGF